MLRLPKYESQLNSEGSKVRLRAKIDGNGQLGRIEVLEALYDDSEGPMLVTFLPPKPLVGSDGDDDGEPQDNAEANQDAPVEGEMPRGSPLILEMKFD